MSYQRPQPDPRDDVKFAAIVAWLKRTGQRGRIKRNGEVVITRIRPS
jgi:hypothetical protein